MIDVRKEWCKEWRKVEVEGIRPDVVVVIKEGKGTIC